MTASASPNVTTNRNFTAPTLSVFLDTHSTPALMTLIPGETPVYADSPEGEQLRRRVESLITHEALSPGWEHDVRAVRDLGGLLARTYSVTWKRGGQEYRLPPANAQLGWFFVTSLRGNLPLTVVALIITVLGTVPIALRQPALFTGEWLVLVGALLARVFYPPWARLALVLPEPGEPGEYRMLALARYDLRLAPLFRRRTWPIAPRRFFLWVGGVLLGTLLCGFLLPKATTIYQSLAFGCLVLLLPLMQVVRGWIGDRKYVLFESLLDDYDSLPRYNPAVTAFIDRVLAEPETVVIADESFQTVGAASPFAPDALHRPVETSFVARKVAATHADPLGRVRDAAFGRTRNISSRP